MERIRIEEIKKIECNLLDDIAQFCEKENISYFLFYGTLIGAIRHNGFIPWDDDIDIAMPRPDYDRFINSFNAAYQNSKVIDMAIDKKYGIPFAKVYDDRTWINEVHYKREEYGVFVDIFPIDGVGNISQLLLSHKLTKLLHTKKANFTRRTFSKKIINAIGKIILLPISVHGILKIMDRNARKYAFGTTKLAGYVSVTFGTNDAVDTSLFQETIFHEFEGKQYRVPKEYDRLLRCLYGDYMQLPPKEKRVPQHIFDAWWKE